MSSLLAKNNEFLLFNFNNTLADYPSSKITDITRIIGVPISTLYAR